MSVNKYIINIGSFLSLCGAFIAMHYTLFDADGGFNFLLSFIFAIISMSMIICSNFKIQHRKIPALGCFMLSFIVCFAMVYGWGEFWTKYSLRNYGRMTRAIISDVYSVRNRYRTVCFFEIDGERFEIVEDGDIRNIGETIPIQYSTNNPNINEIIHSDD